MRSIHCQHPSLIPHLNRNILKSNPNNSKFISPRPVHFTSSPVTSLRTNAIHDSLLVILTAQPKPVDKEVLLQTGSLMFGVYLFSNFIVPDLMSKYFKFDEIDEEQKPEE
ncbi:hypothetical protein ACFE04_021875 [Oxalis oulophora]